MKKIAAVVCRSFFFSALCFAFVQWCWYWLNGLFFMLLLVVVFLQWLRYYRCVREALLFNDRPVIDVALPCMLFFTLKIEKEQPTGKSYFAVFV